MKCLTDTRTVLRFIDKEMTKPERDKFLMHLEACPSCLLELEKAQSLVEALKSEPGLTAPSAEAVMNRIDRNHYKKSALQKWIHSWPLALRKAAIPAVSLLVIGTLLAVPLTRNLIGSSLYALLDKESRMINTFQPAAPNDDISPLPSQAATQKPLKAYHNRAVARYGGQVYSKPDSSSPVVDEIKAQLADKTKSHELNQFDEVVNGFVHIENDEGFEGWVKEEDFSYWGNYKNFSYEKNTLDLNGDNKSDTIKVGYIGGSRDDYRLEINEAYIDGNGIEVVDQFRLVDIDPHDPYIEVVIEELGPSSDPKSSFYYYDGSDIHFMGKIEGLCGDKKTSVRGDGKVAGVSRGQILETWFYLDYYKADENRMLVKIPQETYMRIIFSDDRPLKVLLPSVSFLEAPGSTKVSLTLQKGDEVFFLGSDDKEWCLFGTKKYPQDGKQGWMRFVEFNKAADLNMSADEIFEGLSYAD